MPAIVDGAAFVHGPVAAGVFAGTMAVLLTAPPRYLPATAICGFAGCMARDLLVDVGMTITWATLLAAVAAVLLGAALLRRRDVPPVVLICGIFPLGAASATLDMMFGLMRIPALQGDPLRAASVALVSNTAKAFTIYLTIAVGISVGMALLRLRGPEERRVG